jgi:hypothetical protein
MPGTPALATLHVWGVPNSAVPRALARMALDRRPLRQRPGLTFAKLLGTGSGSTFGVRDSDPTHWGVLAVWDAPQAAAAFERSGVVRRWDSMSGERLRLLLEPFSAKGRWSGREPFGRPHRPAGGGLVAALTRARLDPRRARAFWKAVPPVSDELHASPGLLLSLGVGEAPVGLQGTFSVWQNEEDLGRFAYRAPEHSAVIRRTRELGWYAEELFARFDVLAASGTYRGRPVESSD